MSLITGLAARNATRSSLVGLFLLIILMAADLSGQVSFYQTSSGFARSKPHAVKALARSRSASAELTLSFANPVSYGSGGYQPSSVVVSDLNGDGKPDVVVANLCASSTCPGAGSVSVLLGNGDGTFRAAVAYGSGGDEAVSVAVGDLNGDGKPDIVVANCTSGAANCGATGVGILGVLLGNGDGTFQPVVTYSPAGSWTLAVAVQDVNGDGKPDLVVANSCTDITCTNGSLAVLLGNGDGTFQAAVTETLSTFSPTSIAVADVNGDGKPDVILPGCNSDGIFCDHAGGTIGVLLGNGDGTFQPPAFYSSGGGGPADSVAVADFNGDGEPDLAVANPCATTLACGGNGDGSVGVLLNETGGVFQTAVTYDSSGDRADSVAVGDLNGDGNPDIVVANESSGVGVGTLGVLLGNGDGSFQNAVTYFPNGLNVSSVTVADVNGDGKPDLIVANCPTSDCSSAGLVTVFLNKSAAATATALASSVNPSNAGQPVQFTATVTTQGSTSIPTGSVGFYDGTTSIGTANLNSAGVATLTTSSLAAGTHSMTAAYNGDSAFGPSTSPMLNQVVNVVPDFSLTVTSQTNITVTPGQVANYAISVASIDGLSGEVSFTCSGAPAQSTCTITPSSVTLNGTNSVPVAVAVSTTGASAAVVQPSGVTPTGTRLAIWLAWPCLPGMLMFARSDYVFRRRLFPRFYRLALLAIIGAIFMWSACGGGNGTGRGGGGTPPGTYTLTVAGSGPANLVHSASLTLVVQ